MALAPDYGETPIDEDELEALLPGARELLGRPVTKADVYDLEQAIAEQVIEERLTRVGAGAIALGDLLSEHFLRDLHIRLYGEIWVWAGKNRTREMTIGVDPNEISVQLRMAFDNVRYRWEHTSDWTARQLGIAVHAETVRIHPFVDGNGRSTRMLADLVFFGAQAEEALEQYDWEFDRARYIALLREYDLHRDVRELAAFVPVRPFEDWNIVEPS